MAGPIFLDTNIFIYAAGKSHPYKNPCLHILKDVERKALSALVNTEVFQELLYRYTHIGFAEKGIQLCRTIRNYPLMIYPINETDILLAIDLFEQHQSRGIKPRDAVHAANLKNNGIVELISADKHFDHFEFLTRIDPQDYNPQDETAG